MSEIAKDVAVGLALFGLVVLIGLCLNWLVTHYPLPTFVAAIVPVALYVAATIGKPMRKIWRAGK